MAATIYHSADADDGYGVIHVRNAAAHVVGPL